MDLRYASVRTLLRNRWCGLLIALGGAAATELWQTVSMVSPSSKLSEPALLLASSNCRKMIRNVRHILDESAVHALEAEIDRNVAALFSLGEHHLNFARSIAAVYWRQRISRLYYGAYNARRAVMLHVRGTFAMDVSDHKNVKELPDDLPRVHKFRNELVGLREDRNLADYSHQARESELLKSPDEAEGLVVEFVDAARSYLLGRGVTL